MPRASRGHHILATVEESIGSLIPVSRQHPHHKTRICNGSPHHAQALGCTHVRTNVNRRAPSRSIVPGIPFEMSFVRSYVKSQSCTGVVFALHATPKPYSRDSANTLSFFLDQSRSHLLSCEHSWAEQTTGLRVSVATSEDAHNREKKNRSEADNKDTRHKNVKLDHTCTSHASQQHHSASDRIHPFPYLHGITSRKRQIDEGITHRYGSSNHYRC